MNNHNILLANLGNSQLLEQQNQQVHGQLVAFLKNLGYKIWSVGQETCTSQSYSVFYDNVVVARDEDEAIEIGIYQKIMKHYPNSIPTQAQIDKLVDSDEWYAVDKGF